MRLSGEMIGCAGKWRIRSFWRGRGGRFPVLSDLEGTVFALGDVTI
ncbi:MAG: hypothetical protein HFH91_07730 [Lachnospiraceae bacterium]|jgi:hypothetical protein|nr:hypothetical protein [Lachnospiraceae bacterium]